MTQHRWLYTLLALACLLSLMTLFGEERDPGSDPSLLDRPSEKKLSQPLPTGQRREAEGRVGDPEGGGRFALVVTQGLQVTILPVASESDQSQGGATPFEGLKVEAWRQVVVPREDGHAHGPEHWSLEAEGELDAQGRLDLAVPVGKYCIWPKGPRIACDSTSRAVKVLAGELRPVTMRLEASSSLHGIVLSSDRRPLVNQEVLLRPAKGWGPLARKSAEPWIARTDRSGRFEFDRLSSGNRTFEIRHATHAYHSQSGRVEPGGSKDFGEIVLDAGSPVRGRITTQAGQPIEGVKVSEGTTKRTALTDLLGRFELPSLSPSVYLYFERAGYVGKSVLVGSPERSPIGDFGFRQNWLPREKSVEVSLFTDHRIDVEVEGALGPVQVYMLNYAETCWAIAAKRVRAGRFVVEGVRAGRCELQAWEPGRGFSTVAKFQAEEVTKPIKLRIEETAGMQVRVVDTLGDVLAGISVSVGGYATDPDFQVLFGSRETTTTEMTNARGVALFGGLFRGKFDIEIDAEGFLPRKLDIDWEPGDPVEVELAQAAGLRVTVKGLPGELRENSRVRIDPLPGARGRDAMMASKSYKIEDAGRSLKLPPATYRVGLEVGQPRRGTETLGKGSDPRGQSEISIVAGELVEHQVEYLEPTQLLGELRRGSQMVAHTVVQGMRRSVWDEAKENAHFLGMYMYAASDARTDRSGQFRFQVAELGEWVFAAHGEGWPLPIKIGEVDIREHGGRIRRTFSLPGGELRGSIPLNLRRADGAMPKVLLLPSWLVSTDPHYADVGETLIASYARPVDANGGFILGPLVAGSWVLRVIDGRRTPITRVVEIGAGPVDLGLLGGEVRKPLLFKVKLVGEKPKASSNGLIITDESAKPTVGAVLRLPASKPSAGAFVGFAVVRSGVLDFGAMALGTYNLEFVNCYSGISKPPERPSYYSVNHFVTIEHSGASDALELRIPRRKF